MSILTFHLPGIVLVKVKKPFKIKGGRHSALVYRLLQNSIPLEPYKNQVFKIEL